MASWPGGTYQSQCFIKYTHHGFKTLQEYSPGKGAREVAPWAGSVFMLPSLNLSPAAPGELTRCDALGFSTPSFVKWRASCCCVTKHCRRAACTTDITCSGCWRLEVPDPHVGKADSSKGLSPQLVDGILPWSFCCMGAALLSPWVSSSPLLIGTLILLD